MTFGSDLLVDIAATARLTRIVNADTITRPLRVRVIREAYDGLDDLPESAVDAVPHKDKDAPKLAAFITCPWCVSQWCAVFVVCARRMFPDVWDPIAKALAISETASLIATHVDR